MISVDVSLYRVSEEVKHFGGGSSGIKHHLRELKALGIPFMGGTRGMCKPAKVRGGIPHLARMTFNGVGQGHGGMCDPGGLGSRVGVLQGI